MSPRARGHGVRKVCRCGWRRWPKCAHAWYFSYKPRGGPRQRFSLDTEFPEQRIDSKTAAEKLASDIRSAINAGTFERLADRRAREQRDADRAVASVGSPVTLEQLGRLYFRDYICKTTGARLSSNERLRWDLVMRTAIERRNGSLVAFGDVPVMDVCRHDLEAFRRAHLEPRRVTVTNRKGHVYTARRGGVAGVRGCLGRLRAFFSWAVDADHVPASPFRKGGIAIKGLFVDEPPRERRLDPGEWERLFAVASPHLQALMTAALETSCRIGELLSLRWQQVRFDLNEMHLRAKDTKARRARELPLSQRFRALLEMRRLDGEGRPWPDTAFVFGDATGAQIKSVKTAWENVRLKAYGHAVRREKNGRLTAECRQQLAAINLRFHDLRREAGSQFLEHGMAANYVQKFLDHAKLSTTSRYLNVTRDGMHAALERFEDMRRADERRTARGKRVAKTAAAVSDRKLRESDKSVQ